jgi:putative DNA primase/helicase
VTIRPAAKHLFAANTLPSADIDDDAFFRRILLVSFPRTVPRDERDPHLFETLADELPSILNWALDGLDRLREQSHFTADLPPAETQGKWRSWGESIERFIQRCIDEDTKATATVPKRDVFDAYRDFCEAEGIPAESKQKFGREMMNTTGVGDRRETIDGKRVWCYTGIDLITGRVPTPDADSHDEGQQHRFGGFGA